MEPIPLKRRPFCAGAKGWNCDPWGALIFGLSGFEILLIAIPLVFLLVSLKRDSDEEARRSGPASPPVLEAEDMTACVVCGVYCSAESRDPCERDDCPFLKSG